ncbi:MAG: PspC domain-containing protein [Acidimicrobiia bacterium]|nr:PspC domain-containing protein [Acidimicrobiia bacterium]
MVTTTQSSNGPATRLRMERPGSGRVLAGVASAIAERTNTETWLVRLGFVIATLFGGFGILAYLAGWLVIPAEGRSESAAEAWLTAMATPGPRAGALLIAFGLLILLTGSAPIGWLVAGTLLITALLLAKDSQPVETK